VSDTPISDSTPHNVGDLGMLCRRLERKLKMLEVVERLATAQMDYIQQLEVENDAMRADLLLWRDTKP
jgi:hypothetical protein